CRKSSKVVGISFKELYLAEALGVERLEDVLIGLALVESAGGASVSKNVTCQDVFVSRLRLMPSASNAGLAMKVVARAISTSIVNSDGDRIPRSSPAFRITNSTNPRVFIKAPKPAESLQFIPVSLAVKAAPASFPATAIAMIASAYSHITLSVNKSMRVRRPVSAKNSGSKRATLSDSIRSTASSIMPLLGKTSPAIKAPNSAWTCKRSVVQLAASMNRIRTEMDSMLAGRSRYLNSKRETIQRTGTSIMKINNARKNIVNQRWDQPW